MPAGSPLGQTTKVLSPCRWSFAFIIVCLSVVLCVVAQTQPNWRQSLFAASDPVAQLWANNFTQVIYHKPHAWIVFFYAAWCGHCRRTAPVYKAFAEKVQGWSPVLRVASVSCSDPYNNDLCRDYEIRGYPTFKYFPANAYPPFRGTPSSDVEAGNEPDDLRDVTLEYLQQQITLGKADQSWPNLQLASSSRDIQANKIGQLFVVVEDRNMLTNHVGLAVALDMIGSWPRVKVRRLDLTNSGQTSPGLYLYTQANGLQLLSRSVGESNILNDIQNHSGTNAATTSSYGSYKTTMAPQTTTPNYAAPRFRPSGLHMRDLESSLYRTLWLEIPAQGNIEAERLEALKNYVQLLDEYHPGEEHVRRFLQELHSWVSLQYGSISEQSWTDKLNSLQTRESFIPQNETYTGCAGSSPTLRGYTCGLWVTFHSLTVSAYQRQTASRSFNPLTVLHPIRDYIRHFFGCQECAEHFGGMAASMDGEVREARDVVLWLWRAHNRVNRRLHGAPESEDPQAPKFQFPPPAACRRCFKASVVDSVDLFNVADTDWSLDGVMEYLMAYYSKSRIIDDHDEIKDASELNLISARRSVEACARLQTDWTPCSRTCDEGLSTRMVSQSADGSCRLVAEIRWCMLRPCNVRLSDWTISDWHIDNCPRMATTYRLSRPRPLSYGNCTTVGSDSWRICGLCPRTRRGRRICCRPSHSITRAVEVTCSVSEAESSRSVGVRSQEARGTVHVEEIQHCVCDEDCPTRVP